MAKKYVKNPYDTNRKEWLNDNKYMLKLNGLMLPYRKPQYHISVEENFDKEELPCQ